MDLGLLPRAARDLKMRSLLLLSLLSAAWGHGWMSAPPARNAISGPKNGALDALEACAVSFLARDLMRSARHEL